MKFFILIKNILKLYEFIPTFRAGEFVILLILTIISSLLEVISIGAVVPFLSLLLNPSAALNKLEYLKLFDKENISNDEVKIYITLVFLFLIVLSSIFRSSLLKKSTNLAFGCGSDISNQVLYTILSQPYSEIIKKNSSEFISALSTKINITIYQIIFPIINLIACSIVAGIFIGTLLFINFYITALTAFCIIFVYSIILFLTKKQLNKNSVIISKNSVRAVKILQEAIGGIRDTKINNLVHFYLKYFSEIDGSFRRAQGSNFYISSLPRYIVETIGIIILSVVGLVLSNAEGGLIEIIPIFGVIVIGAQRLLPLAQQIYYSWSVMKGGEDVLNDILDILEIGKSSKPFVNHERDVTFTKSIEMVGVEFAYEDIKIPALTNVNLKINKGEIVGIIGVSGSGKSTLVDLIMGLIDPTAGFVKVDGQELNYTNKRAWMNKIAHVPQDVFIYDASVIENIALGSQNENIDFKRLEASAKIAGIHDYISSLQGGYNTVLEENGNILSGGQKQRIAIARALYRCAELLIMDEATSGLDIESENKLFKQLSEYDKELTVIIISHNHKILDFCKKVYVVDNKTISTYKNKF